MVAAAAVTPVPRLGSGGETMFVIPSASDGPSGDTSSVFSFSGSESSCSDALHLFDSYALRLKMNVVFVLRYRILHHLETTFGDLPKDLK